MLKETIGITCVALGVSTADSEWLIVPLTLMAIGFILLRGCIKWQ